jgi:hypothetical protein
VAAGAVVADVARVVTAAFFVVVVAAVVLVVVSATVDEVDDVDDDVVATVRFDFDPPHDDAARSSTAMRATRRRFTAESVRAAPSVLATPNCKWSG